MNVYLVYEEVETAFLIAVTNEPLTFLRLHNLPRGWVHNDTRITYNQPREKLFEKGVITACTTAPEAFL